MQGVIRHQVINILQPVTETIQEIQAQLEHFEKDLALTDGRLANHESDLEQYGRNNIALRASNADIKSQLGKFQVETTKVSEELACTNQDLQVNKTALAKLNETTQHNKAADEELQQKFDDMDTMTRLMKREFGQFDQVFRTHIKNFNQLKDHHNDLHTRHMEHGSKLEQVEQKTDCTDCALQKFLKDHRHQRVEDTQILSNLTEHMKELTDLVDDTRESLHVQGLEIKTANADIQLLTVGLAHENYGFKLGQLECQHLEVAANLQRIVDRLADTDHILARLGDEFVANKLSVQSILKDLSVTTADNMNSISELAKAQQRHRDVLQETVWRTDKAQNDHSKPLASRRLLASREGVNKVTARTDTPAYPV